MVTVLVVSPENKDAELFRVMRAEGVDFYFCGEVHDTTARQHSSGGPVQVCHGCRLDLAADSRGVTATLDELGDPALVDLLTELDRRDGIHPLCWS